MIVGHHQHSTSEHDFFSNISCKRHHIFACLGLLTAYNPFVICVLQAMMLGMFPKMTIIHTGRNVEGQVYIPEVNYTLMVLCIAVTVGFQSTSHLGEAFGKGHLGTPLC